MVEQLTALIESPLLSDDQRRYAHYALGKTYDDLADYRSAIGHFDIANSLSRQVQFGDKTFPYAEFRATFEAIKRSFSSEFLRRNRTSFGDPSARPLFIVGMLRSGTTLLEQILSCHPDIVAGGELTFWLDQPAKAALHTVLAGQIEASGIGRLAGQYVRTIGQIAGNSLHVTDKMPNNYMALGLVHLAFPNAKIIHCRRDPGDTCLSIYTTVFSQPPKFAYDRDSIVAAYGLYQDLMEHWTAVIPAESLLTVDYERLIANPESVTRRIAEFCGLPWDQAFLNHQENPRAVNTPSLWQVRQPLYPTSIGRWKNYEPWLGSFDLLHHQEELAEANG
jgi:hypothetical protein